MAFEEKHGNIIEEADSDSDTENRIILAQLSSPAMKITTMKIQKRKKMR
jgi:hypothetical protein